jgi:hypothetical protein
MAEFNPNRLTFEQGLERIRDASSKAGFDPDKEIVTSRSESARYLMDQLKVTNVPDGFSKWQLPISFACATQTYLSFAAPQSKVPRHSHKEGPGLRVIISGSLNYDGTELVAGDWMYIPAGQEYDFEVGPMGVGMFYCYCCSCA